MNGLIQAIAQLRRRCHAMITELEAAAGSLKGDELKTAIDMITEKYGTAA